MAQPLAASDRIEEIDVLRGLALFGVLAINLVGEGLNDALNPRLQR